MTISVQISELYAIAEYLKRQPSRQPGVLEVLLDELKAVRQDMDEHGFENYLDPDNASGWDFPSQVEVDFVRELVDVLAATFDSADADDEVDLAISQLTSRLSREVWEADGSPISVDVHLVRDALSLLDLAVRSGSPEAPRGLALLSPLAPAESDGQEADIPTHCTVPADVVKDIVSILRTCSNEFTISMVGQQATETVDRLDLVHQLATDTRPRRIIFDGAILAAAATAAVTPLARALLLWVRQRKSDVKLEITRYDGSTASVEATHLAEPEKMLARLAQILDEMPPGPAQLPAADLQLDPPPEGQEASDAEGDE
ncbi:MULTISPECIES: effector-associated constant component EACC1 [unclassified Streptomyces]|uniref:effector-associated constant component EACC1 n=1 Tax=unclassified Streptomyces TaxID=2593676 RepID=UPI00288817CD|nr:hypothetical protein [Streptomyces sp. DSM 41633]